MVILVFDANGKLPPGLTNGNTGDLGDFDVCLSVKKNDEFGTPFNGKYCLGNLNLVLGKKREHARNLTRNLRSFKFGVKEPETFSLQWAMCIPDVCTGQEAADILSGALNVYIHVDEYMCQIQEDISRPFTTGAIATM